VGITAPQRGLDVKKSREHPVGESAHQSRRRFKREMMGHMNSLYATAVRMTSNPNDAEDLVQETYFKAFRFHGQFQPGTNAKAWIFRILMNSFINRYNRRRREPVPMDLHKREPAAPPEGYVPFSETAALDDRYAELLDDEVKRALEVLPEQYRAVLLLNVLEGFSYKEIADILDCPVGTVMSRLHRGREALRLTLRDYATRNGFLGSRR